MHEFQLKFHRSLFLGVQLTIFWHWFRYWLGVDQAPSHYLNHWWPSLSTHICVTRPQWVKLYWWLRISDGLTHWGRVTQVCVRKLTIIGADNGLSPGRRQAIIWTNAAIWLIEPLGTNFNEILIEILTCSFKKMGLKVSSVKWRPFCLRLNVLMWWQCGVNNHQYA